ncbi:cytochrome c oxidase subunit NDUFA4-like [Anneissia japonica]|uniref:cytochrome c oxidase subunit NDUFA4-like n=1 Tax=Anneissia japonica TaxID=1529436 RepID=UPI00142592D8|nr:cytochrome c oxidase subunit NDUFA4-like [Anneissia japonica]
MTFMQGLSMKTLRHHYSLVPLFISVGAGALLAAYYLGRLAIKSPDASWDRKNNPHPWTKIKPDQNIKFIGAGNVDFKNRKQHYPDYKD